MNRDEDEVITMLVNKYINKLITITPVQSIIIIRYVLPQREHSMYGTAYIPVGAIEDRVRYTCKLNAELQRVCEATGILFFANYMQNEVIDAHGTLMDECCDGSTHYNAASLPFVNDEIRIFCGKHIPCKNMK